MLARLAGLRPAVRTKARVGGECCLATAARAATLRYAALRAKSRGRRVERTAARAYELAQRQVGAGHAPAAGRRLPAPVMAIAIAAVRVVRVVQFAASLAVMAAAMAALRSAAVPAAV
ncbi:hypothetical protein BVI2075_540007 [Burkholderia vietnamiensis]|nr:hypothetical protein BVI2075_540007 [Burkholderia vietnamiensis]